MSALREIERVLDELTARRVERPLRILIDVPGLPPGVAGDVIVHVGETRWMLLGAFVWRAIVVSADRTPRDGGFARFDGVPCEHFTFTKPEHVAVYAAVFRGADGTDPVTVRALADNLREWTGIDPIHKAQECLDEARTSAERSKWRAVLAELLR